MLHRFLRRSGERARRRRCALRQSHPAAPRGYNRGDTSAYARLIGGRYEWYTGFVDTITRRGDRLYIVSTGDTSPIPMTAAGDGAFYVDGDPTVGFFVRDARGKVYAELVHFLDGRLVVALRAP